MAGFGMDDRLLLTGGLLVVAAIALPNVLKEVALPGWQKGVIVTTLVVAIPALVYGISWWRHRGD